MKIKVIILLVCLVSFLLITDIKAQRGSSPWESPYSWITTSENGEFIFVLLSSQNLDDHVRNAVSSWKTAGVSKDDLSKFTEDLLRDMEAERTTRQKYKMSGLFKKGSLEKPIFKVEDFPQEIDSIFVANDGSYIIGLNRFVTMLNIGANPSKSELVKTQQDAIVVLFPDGRESCSYKLADFISEKDKLGITSEGFYWAEEKSSLDNRTNTLKIEKLNGDEVLFNAKTCKISQENSSTSSESTSKKSPFCGGLTLFVSFCIIFLLTR
jgi:hypothetical protein